MIDGVKSCTEDEKGENAEVTRVRGEERRRSLVTLRKAVSVLCCERKPD